MNNKKFPTDYSIEITNIINQISLSGNHEVVGSMSQKGFLYPNDIDVLEVVKENCKNIDEFCTKYQSKFKNIMKKLMKTDNIIIGDIKAGEINHEPVRWKPKQILDGKNNNYLLKNAFVDDALFKLDIIAYIQNIFTEISIIYVFENNGKQLNNFKQSSIKDDVKQFKEDKNYFKMAKRMYFLKPNKKLLELFNSSIGAINQVNANIMTLTYILENKAQLPFKKIDVELDGFITRLNLLANKKLMNNSHLNILIKEAENADERKLLLNDLNILYRELNTIVQEDTKRFLINYKIKF